MDETLDVRDLLLPYQLDALEGLEADGHDVEILHLPGDVAERLAGMGIVQGSGLGIMRGLQGELYVIPLEPEPDIVDIGSNERVRELVTTINAIMDRSTEIRHTVSAEVEAFNWDMDRMLESFDPFPREVHNYGVKTWPVPKRGRKCKKKTTKAQKRKRKAKSSRRARRRNR